MKFTKPLIAFILIVGFVTSVYAEPAGVITWQNSKGYWFAVGPVQVTWSGYKSEAKAIDMVANGTDEQKITAGYPSSVTGKYRIYWLNRELKSHETSCIKYTERKGWIRWSR